MSWNKDEKFGPCRECFGKGYRVFLKFKIISYNIWYDDFGNEYKEPIHEFSEDKNPCVYCQGIGWVGGNSYGL